MTVQVHTRCDYCGRLLAPQRDGTLPRHRMPRTVSYAGGSTPLTGLDSPWCGEVPR